MCNFDSSDVEFGEIYAAKSVREEVSYYLSVNRDKLNHSVYNQQTRFLTTIKKMRNNNLSQYPSNKPINTSLMISYNECMPFNYL
jgi:hypothetical protein